MKFAHMADVHLGSFRDPKLKELSSIAFEKAIDTILKKQVDFLLIAGDLFNNALPSIDIIKHAVKQLKRLKDKDIRVYAIAGSHDYSTNGKTMLDVLEEAGLLINVLKGTVENDQLHLAFTQDQKTGAKITGILGKRGMLDRSYYEQLNHENLEKEEGFKIFMFHTALTEFKPKGYESMNSSPLALLPKHFNYYAGGHVHFIFQASKKDYGLLTYPGPLFPANFAELEELHQGGFWMYDNGNLLRETISLYPVKSMAISLDKKTAEQANLYMQERIQNEDVENAIVLLRFSGTLKGKTSELAYRDIVDQLYEKKAYFVMKNTAQLISESLLDVEVKNENPLDIEQQTLQEHAGQITVSFDEIAMAKKLISILSTEKHEGEKSYQYEERIKKEINEAIGF